MVVDPTRRIERYLVKSDPELVAQVLKRLRQSMSNRMAQATAELVRWEIRAKQVLNVADVPTILYPAYLNFAREVFARKRRFAGNSLSSEVNRLIEKWVSRQLDRSVLEALRDDQMGSTVPGEAGQNPT